MSVFYPDDVKKDPPTTVENLDDGEMSGTMMDINVESGAGPASKGEGKKSEPLTPRDRSDESVEALLKKEKSFLNKIGIGKLFQKKK